MSGAALLIIKITAAVVAGVGILSLLWYSFWFERVNFKLSKVTIKINYTLKAPGPMLTILHLSDFHLRKDLKGARLFSFIQGLKGINPDFIFITGDLVEKNQDFDYVCRMLDGLQAKCAKYAVFGVHDYFNKTPKEFLKNMIKRRKRYNRENDIETLIRKMDDVGIKVLRNENACHEMEGGLEVTIAGLEDSIIGLADINKAFREETNLSCNNHKSLNNNPSHNNHNGNPSIPHEGEIRKAFKVSGQEIHELQGENRMVICLTHTPDNDILAGLIQKKVDLIICGHTHGGQVRIPGIGALVSGCNIKTRYASGLFYFKKIVLYVSRGLGEGRYSPFRFYCQPEASLLEIISS